MGSSRSGRIEVAALAAVAVLLCLSAQLAAADSADSPPPAQPASHSPLSFFAGGPHNSSAPMDPLDIGMAQAMKMDFWSVYVFFNFLGCVLCAALIVSVFRLPLRSSSDVLAGALCWSCFVMSASCGTQCLLNLLAGGFAHGMDACYVEALFHLISIISMFWTLALMAFDSHRTVVKGESMGVRRAIMAVSGVWAFTALGVGLFSLASPIYMAPSGVFCFFAFDSALMYAFFLPSFLIAAGAMAFFYFRVFRATGSTLQRMHASNATVSQNRAKLQMRLARKLFLFVLVFLASWMAFVVGILVQLISGRMESLDAIGGVTGAIHSSAVPIAYGLINPRLRTVLLDTISCGAWSRWLASQSITAVQPNLAKSDTLQAHRAKDTVIDVSNCAQPSHKASVSASEAVPMSSRTIAAAGRIPAGLVATSKGPTLNPPLLSKKSSPPHRPLGVQPLLRLQIFEDHDNAAEIVSSQDHPAAKYQVERETDSLLISPPARAAGSNHVEHASSPRRQALPLMELPNAVVANVERERDEPPLSLDESARFSRLRSLALPPPVSGITDIAEQPQPQRATSPSLRLLAPRAAVEAAAGAAELLMPSPPSPPSRHSPASPSAAADSR